MTLAVIESVALVGADASLVQVEVDIGQGMPGFRIVGLPNASVREAEQRVRAALVASGGRWVNVRKTANLAPGSLPKHGTHFDLALALGVAGADNEIDLGPDALKGWVCIGELALDGSLRRIPGVLAAAMEARCAGRRGLICPRGNAPEAALVEGIEVVGVETLRQTLDFLNGRWEPGPIPEFAAVPEPPVPDLRSVRGHAYAKRALEVAAAGGHNLFLYDSVLLYSPRENRLLGGRLEWHFEPRGRTPILSQSIAAYPRMARGPDWASDARRRTVESSQSVEAGPWPPSTLTTTSAPTAARFDPSTARCSMTSERA